MKVVFGADCTPWVKRQGPGAGDGSEVAVVFGLARLFGVPLPHFGFALSSTSRLQIRQRGISSIVRVCSSVISLARIAPGSIASRDRLRKRGREGDAERGSEGDMLRERLGSDVRGVCTVWPVISSVQQRSRCAQQRRRRESLLPPSWTTELTA